MESQKPLVSINKRVATKKPGFGDRFRRGPVADKFFFVGALSGFIGTILIGGFLWLIKTGELPASTKYFELRELHSRMQLFLLFGLPIVGFLVQAGPRFLNLEGSFPLSIVVICGMLPPLSVGIDYFLGSSTSSHMLLSGSYFIILLWLLHLKPQTKKFTPQAPFLILSLTIFTIASFLPSSITGWGLFTLIGGPGSAILGASQIFIPNLLGGRKLSIVEGATLLIIQVACLISLIIFQLSGSELAWHCFGFASMVLFSFFIIKTRLIFRSHTLLESPMAFCFISGFLWALVTSVVSLVQGPASADGTLHLFATGWIFPILVSVTLHISGFLSGIEKHSQRGILFILILWQIVPIIRGLGVILGFGSKLGWPVVGAAFCTVALWFVILAVREKKILIRQLQLGPNETMVTEA